MERYPAGELTDAAKTRRLAKPPAASELFFATALRLASPAWQPLAVTAPACVMQPR